MLLLQEITSTYLTHVAPLPLITHHMHMHTSAVLSTGDLHIFPCNAALWFITQHLLLTIRKNCSKLQSKISIEDILLNLLSQRVSEQCETQVIVSEKTQLQRSQTLLAHQLSTACSEKLTIHLLFDCWIVPRYKYHRGIS